MDRVLDGRKVRLVKIMLLERIKLSSRRWLVHLLSRLMIWTLNSFESLTILTFAWLSSILISILAETALMHLPWLLLFVSISSLDLMLLSKGRDLDIISFFVKFRAWGHLDHTVGSLILLIGLIVSNVWWAARAVIFGPQILFLPRGHLVLPLPVHIMLLIESGLREALIWLIIWNSRLRVELVARLVFGAACVQWISARLRGVEAWSGAVVVDSIWISM